MAHVILFDTQIYVVQNPSLNTFVSSLYSKREHPQKTYYLETIGGENVYIHR